MEGVLTEVKVNTSGCLQKTTDSLQHDSRFGVARLRATVKPMKAIRRLSLSTRKSVGHIMERKGHCKVKILASLTNALFQL